MGQGNRHGEKGTSALAPQVPPLMTPLQNRSKSRSGFTLFEAIITLVVISVIASVAFVGIQSVSDRTDDRVLVTQLESVRAAGRTVAAASAGTFPEDTVDRLKLSGMTASEGPSTDRTEVSVWVISPTRIGYAIVDGRGGCIGVWDDLERTGETAVVWLRDYDAADGNCLGRVVYAQDPRIVLLDNHSYDNPGDIDFDGGYPDPVTGLDVRHVSPERIRLSWEMPGGPTTDAFRVERAMSESETGPEGLPEDLDFVEVALIEADGNELPETSWLDRNPPLGTNVFYRVSSRGRVLQLLSPPGDPAHILSIPPKPAAILAEPNETSTDLSFSPSQGDGYVPEISFYQLYVGDFAVDPSFLPTDVLEWTYTSGFAPSPWTAGVSSTFSVEACNASGCSFRASTVAESAPSAPSLTATPGVGNVQLTWDPVERGASYTIDRSAGPAGTGGWLGTFGDTVTLRSPGLNGENALGVSSRTNGFDVPGIAEAAFSAGTNGVNVSSAGTYSASAAVALLAELPAATVSMRIRWFDASGTLVETSTSDPLTASTAGTVAVIGERPTDARYASPAVVMNNIPQGVNDAFAIDDVVFIGPDSSANLLPGGASSFEQAESVSESVATVTPATLPMWVPDVNTTPSRKLVDGNWVADLRANSTGTVAAWTASTSNAVPVSPTDSVEASAQLSRTSGTGSAQVTLEYLSAGGTVVGQTSVPLTVGATASTAAVAATTPPLDARFARLRIEGNDVGAGESLRVDDVIIQAGSGNLVPAFASNFTKIGIVDVGVPPGAEATYIVRAVNGEGTASAAATASATPTAIPNATTLRYVTGDMLSIHVGWYPLTSDSAPVQGWQVWYSYGGSWLFGCTAPAEGNNCTIAGLNPEATVYTVAIPVSGGVFGASSNMLSDVTLGASSPPTSVAAQVLTDALVVDWNYPSRDDGYPIQSWLLSRNGGARFPLDEPRPTAWWTSEGAVDEQTTETKRNGSGSLKLTATTAGTKSLYFGSTATQIVPLLDQRAMQLSGCFKPAATRTVTLSITPVRRSGTTHTPLQKAQTLPGGVFTCVTHSATLPFDVYTAALEISVSGMASGEVLYADDLGFLVNGVQRLPASLRTFEKLSYLNTGLANGSSHNFSVIADNGYIWSDSSATSTDKSPAHLMSVPATPSTPTATKGLNTSQIRVTRVALPTGGSNGYPLYLYYRGSTLKQGPTSSSSYTESSLGSGSQYCYTVRARNGAGTSAASNQICGWTTSLPPGNVHQNKRTWNTQEIDWNSVTNATSYEIRRNSASSGSSTTATQRNMTGLSSCQTSTWSVRAKGPWGSSAWSSGYSARTRCGDAYWPGDGARVVTKKTMNKLTWYRYRATSWSAVYNDARAAFINVTADPVSNTAGWVAVQPALSNNSCPTTTNISYSVVNFNGNRPGQSTTGQIVDFSPGGYICVMASQQAYVWLDIIGSYRPVDGGYMYDGLTQKRVRSTSSPNAGTFVTTGAGKAWVHTTTTAVTNGADSYATSYRYGRSWPGVTTLSTRRNGAAANAQPTRTGSGNRINTKLAQSQSVFIIDQYGRYDTTGDPARVISGENDRVLDTRSSNWTMSGGRKGVALQGGQTVKVNTSALSAVPSSGVKAVSGIVVAAPMGVTYPNGSPSLAGHLSVFPASSSGSCNGTVPPTSATNFSTNDGVTTAAASAGFHVDTNSKGEFCVYAAHPTHVIADVTAWFGD